MFAGLVGSVCLLAIPVLATFVIFRSGPRRRTAWLILFAVGATGAMGLGRLLWRSGEFQDPVTAQLSAALIAVLWVAPWCGLAWVFARVRDRSRARHEARLARPPG